MFCGGCRNNKEQFVGDIIFLESDTGVQGGIIPSKKVNYTKISILMQKQLTSLFLSYTWISIIHFLGVQITFRVIRDLHIWTAIETLNADKESQDKYQSTIQLPTEYHVERTLSYAK